MQTRVKRQPAPGLTRRIYYAPDIMQMTGWSRSTLWRRVKAGRFPEPTNHGRREEPNEWNALVVDAHLGRGAEAA